MRNTRASWTLAAATSPATRATRPRSSASWPDGIDTSVPGAAGGGRRPGWAGSVPVPRGASNIVVGAGGGAAGSGGHAGLRGIPAKIASIEPFATAIALAAMRRASVGRPRAADAVVVELVAAGQRLELGARELQRAESKMHPREDEVGCALRRCARVVRHAGSRRWRSRPRR